MRRLSLLLLITLGFLLSPAANAQTVIDYPSGFASSNIGSNPGQTTPSTPRRG